MRRILSILVVFYLILSFKIPVVDASSTGFVDLTMGKRAAELDAGRGRHDCQPPEVPSEQQDLLDKLDSSSKLAGVNSGAMFEYSTRNGMYQIISALTGEGATNCTNLQTYFRQNSFLAKSTQMIAGLYNTPPANTATYVADVAGRAGFMDKAYAQGIGYSALGGMIKVWQVFRDLALTLVVVVVLVMGIIIMFRRSLDPQTALTIQVAIPKIIIAVILIYFSYAIVGVVIDLMYFAIFLVIEVFAQTGYFSPADLNEFKLLFTSGSMWSLFGGLLSKSHNALGNILAPNAGGAVGSVLIGGVTGAGLTGIIAAVLGFPALGGIMAAGSLLFYILFLVMITYVWIRTWLMLLGAYINILLGLIFGPVQILAGVFGGESGFGSWIRNLLASASTFVVVSGIWMLAIVFELMGETGDLGGQLWNAPFIGSTGSNGSVVSGVISLGVLLLLPKAGEFAHAMFQSKPSGIAQTPVGIASSFLGMPFGIIGTMVNTAIQQKIHGRLNPKPS